MILVTGASGFIASHVVDALLEKGEKVLGIDIFFPNYDKEIKKSNLKDANNNENFTFEELDFTNQEAVNELFDKYEFSKIIHLGALPGVRSERKIHEYSQINIDGTLNLLEAAKNHGIKTFLFASSSSIYGNKNQVPLHEDQLPDPISPYAATKAAGEALCHYYSNQFDMNITCLRFFTVYGPRQRPDMAIHKFTKLIKNGEPITIYGDGTSERDYTFITDIVDGIMLALEKDVRFEIINLGNSDTVELKYLIELIEKAVGKEANKIYKPEHPRDVKITYADISKARELLGYSPKVKIEEGVKKFVSWYNETFPEEKEQLF